MSISHSSSLLKPATIFRRVPDHPTSTTTLISADSTVFDVYNRHQVGHRKLGSGGKKNVYTALSRINGNEVAYLSCIPPTTRPHAIYQEYRLNLLLTDAGCEPIEGSYLVKPWGSKKDGIQREVYLAKKWAGDLFELIESNPEALFTEPNTKLSIALQLAGILTRLHDLNYIHRDFKPENILYEFDELGGLILRLSDLDSAVELGAPIHDSPVTLLYTPPEMWIALRHGHPLTPIITKQYDGWQLGMVLRLTLTNCWEHLLFAPYVSKAMEIESATDDVDFQAHALSIFETTPSRQSEWIVEADPDGDPVEYAIFKLQQLDPSERWTPQKCYKFLLAAHNQESPSTKRQRR